MTGSLKNREWALGFNGERGGSFENDWVSTDDWRMYHRTVFNT